MDPRHIRYKLSREELPWTVTYNGAWEIAVRIREYWRDEGYDVPVEVVPGSSWCGYKVVLPTFVRGMPPASMRIPGHARHTR